MADPRLEAAEDDVRQMLALRHGDPTAFDALFNRHAGALLRYLERMVKSRAHAEELVQETFLRVYRARERYEASARFSTWLYTIATRIALNELRRPGHMSLDADDDEADFVAYEFAAPGPGVESIVDARRKSEVLEGALAELPERQRAALWLAAVEGLSYAEVADALEASESSIKALVHRARTKLAKHFQTEPLS